MANNRLEFVGLDQLLRDLRNLPEHLAAEAAAIIERTTSSAEAQIAAGYAPHRRTGELAGKLKATTKRDGFSVIGTVRDSSPIAHIFENGTEVRRTDRGAFRGRMPANHVFVPVVSRQRRRMYELLKELVAAQGLEVSGDA